MTASSKHDLLQVIFREINALLKPVVKVRQKSFSWLSKNTPFISFVSKNVMQTNQANPFRFFCAFFHEKHDFAF